MFIRFAKSEDEPRIVQFIKENWNGNPILYESSLIFEYQYMRMNECGFVLAENDEGNICGIKGFIPENTCGTPDIAAALAIVKKGDRPMLNMEMQRFLEKNTNCRMSCSTGLNSNTAAKIYPLFRYHVEKLKQYYRLNPDKEYKISKIEHFEHLSISDETTSLIYLPDMETLVHCFEPDDYTENRPYKDRQYIRYRFFQHPVYEYRVYGVSDDGVKAKGLLVTRELECCDSRVIRVMDYIGDRAAFGRIGSAVDELLKERDAEYIDFFCYGMPEEYMAQAGFSLREAEDSNIIPNYFEPYVQENVEVIFFCNLHNNFLICKSDGDQDRPSILPGKKD